MKDSELGILRHALGIGEDGRNAAHRHHFVTGPGSTDYDTCCALVERGLMVRREGGILAGGDALFLVTHAGVEACAEHAPPPETRSQRRYREFLEADSGLSFGAWLKRRCGARLAGESA